MWNKITDTLKKIVLDSTCKAILKALAPLAAACIAYVQGWLYQLYILLKTHIGMILNIGAPIILCVLSYYLAKIRHKNSLNSKISSDEITLLSAISVFSNMSHKPVPAKTLSWVFSNNITITCQILSVLLSREPVICTNAECGNPMDFTYMLSPKGTLSIRKSPKTTTNLTR